ncbi:DNA polymerase III subunit alpha [Arthrobacter psychrochitiniphilus]|uniref:DNA-directed DNA polymerase n=1 Tax=Arthrobacter psychrochitiniphilus TaxID=291045 RepID=A0A2V3DQH0_9MICC|nr:DNA polymerase III subunit alpha [Arthrobacter psychrochitiniphilus]NYG17740.1 error-prone DNA polymerase [Arthrobacter psychrochitiniphilus]PXA65205.1 DNA polymerase III subunit alpha [Arthrobacter psychrochitiniphilus]
MRNFIHLHAATAFSAHFGVSWPEEMAQAAAADGADALAITDRDGLYGAVKHVKACMAAGIDPIIGVDVAVREEVGDVIEVTGRVVVLAHGGASARPGAGYGALCRLISTAHSAPKGPVGLTLTQLAQGVLDPESGRPVLSVLLGPYSPVGKAMESRKYLLPRSKFKQWKEAMPAGSLVAEITSHLNAPGDPLSTTHAVRMVKLAQEFDVPAVLSNAVRYVNQEDGPIADVLDAAKSIASLAALNTLQPTGQAWLKSAAQMGEIARDIVSQGGYGSAGLARLWANTAQLADKCRLDPSTDLGWKQPHTPESEVLGLTQTAGRELQQRTESALVQRFAGLSGGKLEKVKDRLAVELGTISELGFETYFLTVAEVSDMIAGMGVRRAARGSGASSLVNYLLGISAVDPIANNLLFERFLSNDRSTLPDIDLDVESAQRHNVYKRIFERFGSKRVTLMSMQNSYRARGAVRDAGLALGLDKADIDQIAKQLWRIPAGSLREALAQKPELCDLAAQVHQSLQAPSQTELEGIQGAAQAPALNLLVDVTERLDSLPRHISMHPCGVILGDSTLLGRTPVQPSGMGLPMSQFDKHDMDAMGMLKLDVLGVRMQSAMAHAVQEIIRLHPSREEVAVQGGHDRAAPFLGEGGAIDLDAIPLDDEPTFELIRSTHTLGCFQIESPGQRELVGKMAPTEFSDLVIDISLFRPGPMKSNMVKPFLESRSGFAQPHYAHPDLIPVLAETHGVTVFHEQVLRTLAIMTGCTLSRADEFRRGLGKAMVEPVVEKYFRDKAAHKGYSPAVIEEVWATLSAFGSFGFCKAHGAAFAVPTYQSAWLKAHHPAEFMAGLWEHDPGMYPRRLLVAEARRMGIPILPLDINASAGEYHAERTDSGEIGVRLSLAGVYGLSATELKRIVAGQPYGSLAELRDKAKLSRPTLKRLAQLGALDPLHNQAKDRTGSTANRADLVAHVNSLPAHKSNKANDPIHGQFALPMDDVELGALAVGLPESSLAEIVSTELDLLSMDVSGHLMDSYAPLLDRLGVSRADQLLGLRNNTEVLVAGVRVATQTPPMRGGKRVVFISVDDGTGCVDTTFFTQAQQKSGPLLFGTRMLLIRGLTRRTGPRGITVQALEAWDLQDTARLPTPPGLVGAPANR